MYSLVDSTEEMMWKPSASSARSVVRIVHGAAPVELATVVDTTTRPSLRSSHVRVAAWVTAPLYGKTAVVFDGNPGAPSPTIVNGSVDAPLGSRRRNSTCLAVS